MEAFFILEKSINKNDVFIDEYTEPESYGDNYLYGLPITTAEEPAKLYYKFKTHRKTDYIGGIHSFPVVSQRFKEILLQIEPSYLEFHSVQLICTKTSEVDTSYSLLNILNNIQCFDWERSEFRTYPTAPRVILGVSRLVVREDAIQDRNIVRMEELPTVILVSARLKQQIETARLTGIQFMQVENYRTGN